VDLSGGQWQRVAVARGLYRDHALIILDEPTAAIDPIEETKLYKRFSDISRDKTAIIVTHRLGSARIADRILVLRDGQIDDVGTHEELISKGGYYAKLYESQAEWYA
jgi:ATP-binding cassette subfamily B protein